MTNKKKRTFAFSLLTGSGSRRNVHGFFKQGISIMLIFWGTFGLATLSSLSFIVMFLPIMWCYSFFHVHNLKSMSEDDFMRWKTAIFHLDQFIGNADHFVKKYRKLIAVFLIIFGVSILWDNLRGLIMWLLPDTVANVLINLFYNVPSIIIAIAIIAVGIHMLNTKKQELDSEETSEKPRKEEHYWEPYRPYQQSRRKQLKLQPLKHKRRNPQNRQLFLRNLLLIHPALRQLLSPQSLLRLLRKLLPEQKRQTDPLNVFTIQISYNCWKTN